MLSALPADLTCENSKAVLVLGGKILDIRPALLGWSKPSGGVRVPLFVCVARFFQAIAAEHSAAVWQHSIKSRRPSGYGSPREGTG